MLLFDIQYLLVTSNYFRAIKCSSIAKEIFLNAWYRTGILRLEYINNFSVVLSFTSTPFAGGTEIKFATQF